MHLQSTVCLRLDALEALNKSKQVISAGLPCVCRDMHIAAHHNASSGMPAALVMACHTLLSWGSPLLLPGRPEQGPIHQCHVTFLVGHDVSKLYPGIGPKRQKLLSLWR